MSVTLNTNVSALGATRRLNTAASTLSIASSRLSSGLRINRAADDAAGLAIASLLKIDSRVFTQGIRNANDAISVFSVAEGAVQELKSITIRVTELAEQAANGVLSSSQRQALDDEAQALIDEFSRITSSTEFNGRKLLDTSGTNVDVQLGYAGDSVSLSLGAFLGGRGSPVAAGDGTFLPALSYPTGSTGLSGLELADVDGDGDLDCITTDHFGLAGVQVKLNQGDGTFGAAASYGTGRDFLRCAHARLQRR